MRRVVFVVAGLVLVLGGWWLSRPPEPVKPERQVQLPKPERPPPVEPVRAPAPPVAADRPPDSGTPGEVEWGAPEMNDADHEVQEARIDARLALPRSIMLEWGGWDGTLLVPDRVANIERLVGPVPSGVLLDLTETQGRLAEEAALTVGSYRLGEIDEAESIRALEDIRQTWESESKAQLGLTDAQYDEVFGLGSL